jgi:hypothetical protein
MDNVFENVIKYIKEIFAMGKKINVNKLRCLIKYILNMVIVICKKIINIVRPTITSLLLLANSKLEKYKLVTIKNEKLVTIKNEKLVTIKNDDIKLLIKLVTDKTINKNVYDKLIVKYNKNRIEKYNIYNNKIEDKNIKKNLDFLEKIIIKKLNIDDTKLFIVILLYYIKNSPHFTS